MTSSAMLARYSLLCASIFISSLTAGSIFTFSLFGPTISSVLHLSMQKTSLIASSGISGTYIFGPIIGAIADRRGPRLIAFIAAVLFSVGYSLIAKIIALRNDEDGGHKPEYSVFVNGNKAPDDGRDGILSDYGLVMALYMLVGVATASSYFSALITSTRTFPNHPGLAIGIPSTLYGLSPIFLSSVAYLFQPSRTDGDLDNTSTVYFLNFLAILLMFSNLLGAFVLDPIEEHSCRNPSFQASNDDNNASQNESDPLLPSNNTNDNEQENEEKQYTGKQLLTSPYFWAIAAVVFFLTGPPEMTIASMGSITKNLFIPGASSLSEFTFRSRLVTIFSISNTIIRLIAGAFSDFLAPKRVSRFTWLIAAAIIAFCTYMFTALAATIDNLWVLSVGAGLSYGIAFTVCPSIIPCIWSIKSFGFIWGLLVYASAIGASLFSLLYGAISDYTASHQDRLSPPLLLPDRDTALECHGRSCISTVYIVSSLGSLMCIGVLWRLKASRVCKNKV